MSARVTPKQQVVPHPSLQFATLKIDAIGEIIDYEYDFFGNKLAVSDAEGNIAVYHRNDTDNFAYHSQFKASNSSVWKLSWAHPKFGDLIAIGSFSRNVAVFLLRGNQWVEVAYHDLHEGSVNQVAWAPYYFGLKLFACSSDGCFSVLELKDHNWQSKVFKGHSMSIHSIAVERRSLLESHEGFEQTYPNIATGSKDKTVVLWVFQQGEYKQKLSYCPHKEAVRKILWREPSYRPSSTQIFSCSEDGTFKLLTANNSQFEQICLLQQPNPIVKIAQSPLGDFVSASLKKNESHVSVIIRQENGNWGVVEEISGE